MGFVFFLFLSILNCKINSKTNCGQYNNTKHNIKSFHCYSSLSFGVKKYAANMSIETVNPIVIAKGRVNFSANILPITPAINVFSSICKDIGNNFSPVSIHITSISQRGGYMKLSMLKPGEKGKITKIGAIGPLKRRLMDMGVLVGEKVKVEKVAPLGDPIEVTIKNYNLSLRKKEAEGIEVEVIK